MERNTGQNEVTQAIDAWMTAATREVARVFSVPTVPVGSPSDARSVLQDCMVFDTIPVSGGTDEDLSAAFRQAEQDALAVQRTLFIKDLAKKGDRASRPDARPRAERRAGRRAYRKATAFYGKTYTITQFQLIAWIAVSVGVVLFSSAILFRVYLWMLEQSQVVLK